MQRELLNLIETLGGRPERILMDPNTAYKMDSVNNEIDLSVEVSPVLPLVQEVVDGLNQHITDM